MNNDLIATILYYQRFMGNYFPNYESVDSMARLCDPNVICETSLNYYNDWAAEFPLNSTLFYKCQNFQLFGPLYFGNNITITKKFINVSTHEGVLIEFDLMAIDNLAPDQFFLDADGVNYISLNLEVIGENICLNEYLEKIYHISLQLDDHTSSNLTINFSNSVVSSLSEHSYGIQNFRIFLQNNCHISCVSCDSGNLNSCINCPVFAQINSSGLCECEDRFYMETNQFTHCAKCFYNCKTCFGSSSTNCLSCFSGDNLVDNQCVSPINQIKFPLEFPSQESFNESALEGWEITQNYQNVINTDCGLFTMVGGYGNFGQTTIMQKNFSFPLPHYAVSILLDLYAIDSWDEKYFSIILNEEEKKYLKGNTEYNFCGRQNTDQMNTIYEIFLHNSSQAILKFTSSLESDPYNESWGINNFQLSYFLCHPTCFSCSGELSTNCLSCYENATHNASNNICVCSEGYFQSFEVPCQTTPCSECFPCSEGCMVCNNVTICETCKSNYYKENDACILCSSNCSTCENSFENCTSCMDGFFLYESQCLPCSIDCKNCANNNSFCVSCNENLYLFENSCLIECPTHYFPNEANICIICFESCLNCSGLLETDCINCHDAYYLDEYNKCNSCNAGCQMCEGVSSNCTFCLENYYLMDSNCDSECPIGFYKDDISRSCLECSKSCLSCSGPNSNECNSCDSSSYLSSTNECLLCNASCLSCINDSNVCTSCLDDTYLWESYCVISCPSNTYLNDKLCVNECPSTKYADNNDKKCYSCDISCYECAEKYSNNCTRCYEAFYLFENQCLSCSNNCKTCMNDSYCISCYEDFYSLEGTCLSECPSHYWANNASKECEACHESCLSCNGTLEINCQECYPHFFFLPNNTCSECDVLCKTCDVSSINCTSCYPNNFLLYSNCLESCPSEGFYQIDDSACGECNSSCKECSGPLYSECISCFSHSFLSSNSCFPCNESCLTCENFQDNCTSCENSLYFHNFSCIFECPMHYFTLETENICRICNDNCNECEINETYCLSCFDGTFLKDNQCLVNCPEGYWENTHDNICEPCHVTCKNCTGATENNCTACFAGSVWLNSSCLTCNSECETCLYSSDYCLNCTNDFYFYLNSCVTECPPHNFLDVANKSCEICHENCLNCSGNSIDQCTSCYEGYYLINDTCQKCKDGCKNCYALKNNCSACLPDFFLWANTCETRCKIGKYQNNLTWTCDLCDPKCRQCIGPLVNNCISCNVGSFLAQTNECLPCNDSCLACETDENHCIYCISGLFLYNFTCFEQCPIGYFGRALDNTCQKCYSILCINCNEFGCNRCIEGYYPINSVCMLCSFNCKTCDFASNNCTSCFSGKFLQDFSCKNQCPKGKWQNAIENRCDLCDASCVSCTSNSPNGCIECHPGDFLFENKCLACSLKCETCMNFSDFCFSCNEHFYLKENECLDECPTGYWADNSSKSCKACTHEGCINCTGPFTCTLCIEGYYLIYGQCRKCHSNCSKCIETEDYCTECNDSFYFYKSKCLNDCPSGYWKNSEENVCSLCDSTCQKCENGTNYSCLTCPTGRYLNDGICTLCPNGCSECISNTVCTSCEKLYYLIEDICLDNCELGYYRNITLNKCMPCDSSCIDCDGGSSKNCIKCLNNEVLLSGSCQKCDSNCSTCDGVRRTDCLSCINGYYLQDGMCVPACKSVNYLSSDSCKRCSYSCNKCTEFGEDKCKECNQSQFLNIIDEENRIGQCFISCPSPLINDINTYTCISECPPKTFLDTTFKVCIACSEFCLTCEGSYYDQCLSCIDSKFFLNKRCYTECPNGYYANYMTKSCEPCINHCLKCITATECEECNDKYYRSIYDSQCILCNNSGTFLQNNTCGNCSYACLLCESATNCSQCQTDFYLYFNNETNETFCIERTHVMPQMEEDPNIPMFYYLTFNETWNALFNNLTNNKSSYTIRIENLSIRNFNYYLVPSQLKPNLWEIYVNLSVSLTNSTYLVLNIFSPNEKLYNLASKTIEIPINKYIFCGFNSYYAENNESCQNISFITPSLKLIQEQTVLLSFSGEFDDLFSKINNLTLIYLENIPKNNYNATLNQISKIEYKIEMEFNQSLLNKPRLIVEFQLPGNLLFHKTSRLYPKSLSIIIGEFFYISDLQAKAIDFLKTLESAVNNILVPFSLVHGVLCSGSFSFIGLTTITFIKYLRYLDLNYPPNALAVFESSTNTRFLPDIFNYNSSIQMPTKFKFYNVKCGFLLNAQDEVFVCLITLIIGLVLKTCLQKIKKKGYNSKLFSFLTNIFFLNVPIILFFMHLFEFSFFSLTNIYWNDSKTTKGSINLISSILALCAIFVVFKYIYTILKEFYPFSQEQNFTQIPNKLSKEEDQSEVSSDISRKNIDSLSMSSKKLRSVIRNYSNPTNPFSLIAQTNVQRKVWWDVENLDEPKKNKKLAKTEKKKMVFFKENVEKYQYDVNYYGKNKRDWGFISVLVSDIKSFEGRYFAFFHMIRYVMLAFVIVFLSEIPYYACWGLLIIESFFFLIFFLIGYFKSNIKYFQYLMMHLCQISSIIGGLALSIAEKQNDFDDDSRINKGWVIFYANLIALLTVVITFLWETFVFGKNQIKNFLQKLKKNKVIPKIPK